MRVIGTLPIDLIDSRYFVLLTVERLGGVTDLWASVGIMPDGGVIATARAERELSRTVYGRRFLHYIDAIPLDDTELTMLASQAMGDACKSQQAN